MGDGLNWDRLLAKLQERLKQYEAESYPERPSVYDYKEPKRDHEEEVYLEGKIEELKGIIELVEGMRDFDQRVEAGYFDWVNEDQTPPPD